jgi:hypothetical protein
MNEITVSVSFPDLGRPEANQRAESLFSELKQDADLKPHLNAEQTRVARNDPEAQDFGVTLIAVLGTPAVIIFAKAIKSWVERTGTTTIDLNGIRIENVRSQDVASIAKAVESAARK